jgi:hypothetical protein
MNMTGTVLVIPRTKPLEAERRRDEAEEAGRFRKAWEHGGADFQSRFDKSTAQAEQMKEGALRVL